MRNRHATTYPSDPQASAGHPLPQLPNFTKDVSNLRSIISVAEPHPKQLIGLWSHGVAHGYYGGSHDVRLALLPDGRGAFIHDGWFTYTYGLFQWQLDGSQLRLSHQRFQSHASLGTRILQIAGLIVLSFDEPEQRERLDIPFVNETNDYYLLRHEVTESDLLPELGYPTT